MKFMDYTEDVIINNDIKICQPKQSGFRFGCDSVLLSAFSQMKSKWNIADIGSGSGVIAALCAKLYGVKVTAIEIQNIMYECLKRTIALCGLAESIIPVQADIKYYKKNKLFDAVICNPPYRNPNSGRTSLTEAERIARFEYKMDMETLLEFCKKNLKHGGKLFFSYDADMLINAVEKCRKFRMEPKRMRFMHPDITSKATIVLVECLYAGAAELKIEPPFFQKGCPENIHGYDEIFKGNWDKKITK